VKRPHVITVKLSDIEDRRFKRVAKKLGLDVSAMLRMLVSEKEAKR